MNGVLKEGGKLFIRMFFVNIMCLFVVVSIYNFAAAMLSRDVGYVAYGTLDEEKEGEKLKDDILSRCDTILSNVAFIEERSPETVKEYNDKLLERIKELGLNEEDYGFYLDLRKYGTARHAGFGLGFERCVMYLTGMSNIRDVIPFPRTVNNCEL